MECIAQRYSSYVPGSHQSIFFSSSVYTYIRYGGLNDLSDICAREKNANPIK